MNHLFSIIAFILNADISVRRTISTPHFPFLAGLLAKRNEYSYLWCGGSLIAKNWILTAAHCMDRMSSVRVYLGATSISTAQISHNVSRSNILMHPEWDAHTMTNDISLLGIPEVNYSFEIQPVRLPQLASNYPTFVGENVIAVGWQRIARPGFPAAHWKRMQIISNAACVRTFSLVTSRDLCAATVTHSTTCFGDSGGPLLLEKSRVQIGLNSFGVPDYCSPNDPSGFMRITSYLEWIKSHTDFCLVHNEF